MLTRLPIQILLPALRARPSLSAAEPHALDRHGAVQGLHDHQLRRHG